MQHRGKLGNPTPNNQHQCASLETLVKPSKSVEIKFTHPRYPNINSQASLVHRIASPHNSTSRYIHHLTTTEIQCHLLAFRLDMEGHL
jgi:hypothetical protein